MIVSAVLNFPPRDGRLTGAGSKPRSAEHLSTRLMSSALSCSI